MSENPAYLVMVTADANNNKYYRMIPQGDNFRVEFGRIGGGFQTATYPIYQWNKKYNEKIKKGYVDHTNLVADIIVKEKPKSKEYIDIQNKIIANIVDRLQQMAKQAIRENYTISSNKVTQAMVDEAQIILDNLISITDLELFNKKLIQLFGVIPRKMSKVSNYLAKENNDFGKIISTEQDLLDVMRGQVVQHSVEDEDIADTEVLNNITILEAMGLQFAEITKEEELKIKKLLGECSGQYKQAWKVENIKTQRRFNDFVEKEGNIETKLLWHGSRNENWWSIVNSGLILRPTNAVITGKMFGYGTYFATKARKSVGYTSLSGSYWAKGNANTAFMSLYEVAYGMPYDVYSFDSKYYNFNYNELQKYSKGSHCLHAHEGNMLRNDEIIVYKEEQTTIKYLVEITN